MRQLAIWIILWVLAVPLPAQTQVKNKYSLVVVSNKKAYDKLNLPNTQQLVWLDTILLPYEKEVVYKTPANFTKQVLYGTNHRFYLVHEAAVQLRAAQDSLLKNGINILLYDSYRPYGITEKMWSIVPDDRYAANPALGSMHNRGLAFDISLANATTGVALPMPTGYDDFTPKAWLDYSNLPKEILQNRELLQSTMHHFGFRSITTEWWHFYWPNKYGCPLLDIDFDDLRSLSHN